jgi:predicted HicB family RNase H-like nuclease
MARKPGIVSLQVRMHEDLRRDLAIEAAKNGRSLNSEIVQRLQWSMVEDEDERAHERPSEEPTKTISWATFTERLRQGGDVERALDEAAKAFEERARAFDETTKALDARLAALEAEAGPELEKGRKEPKAE